MAVSFSVKAQAQVSENQDGFKQVYQFYKDKIVIPQYFKSGNSNENKLTAPRHRPVKVEIGENSLPIPPSFQISKFISKVFSPIIKSTGKIKDGYLSIGDEILSLIDSQSDNLSAILSALPADLPAEEEGEAREAGAVEIMDFLKTQVALLEEQVKKIEKSGLVFSASAPSANADKIKKEIAVLASSASDLSAGLSAEQEGKAGVTKEYLEERLNSINTNLLNQINNLSSQLSVQTSAVYRTVSLTNKIDSLSGTSLSNITVSGVSGLTDSDIPDTITASSYLSLSGGTLTGAFIGTALSLSGQLTVSGAGTSTLAGDTNFDSGTLYIDSINNRVGIASSSPSETLSLNGAAYLSQISAPSVSADRLYNTSGDLYWNGTVIGSASVGNWTSASGNVYRSTGNVGIGTTSPGTILSVSGVGNFAGTGSTLYSTLTAPYFTATSTTATSTFAGGFSAGNNSAFVINQAATANSLYITSGGNVGIGTAAPTRLLHIGTDGSSNQTMVIQSDSDTNGTYAGLLFRTAQIATDVTTKGGVFFEHTGTNGRGSLHLAVDTISDSGNVDLTDAKLTIDSSGNIGIGTTSPYAKLSVVGETVAEKFTATSTTATSTFNGDINFGITSNLLQGGQRFLTSSTTGAGNLTIGYQSATGLDANGGLYNTGVGYQALGNATSTDYNTALGYQALKGSATIPNIGYNTAVGYRALYSNTTGYYNTANGYVSLTANTTGYGNTANGIWALSSNTTGYNNVGIGYNTLGSNISGYNNTANGYASLSFNTTGYYNTANGYFSFRSNTTGAGNVGLGFRSGYGDSTTEDQRSVIDNYATFIGYQASRSESVASTSALTNITAIGKNARVAQSNAMVLGGTGSDAVNVGIGTTSPWAKLSIQNTYGSLTPLFDIASSTSAGYATSSMFRVNADGNVGIGTTSPYAKLSVVGETVAEKFTATSTTATSTFAGGALFATGGGSAGIGCSNPDHIFEIGGTGTGCNTGAGSYLNVAGDLAFTANSSREWKQNIATYGKSDILSRIKNAPVRTFDWKPEYCPGGNCLDKLGFIAEEFYGVLERGDDKHINGQDVTMALWLGMQNFINVFDIASAATGTPALVIDALGNWKIGNDGALTVKEVRTEKLCVGSVCVTEEQFRSVFGNSQSSSSSGESSSTSSTSDVLPSQSSSSTSDVIPAASSSSSSSAGEAGSSAGEASSSSESSASSQSSSEASSSESSSSEAVSSNSSSESSSSSSSEPEPTTVVGSAESSSSSSESASSEASI